MYLFSNFATTTGMCVRLCQCAGNGRLLWRDGKTWSLWLSARYVQTFLHQMWTTSVFCQRYVWSVQCCPI